MHRVSRDHLGDCLMPLFLKLENLGIDDSVSFRVTFTFMPLKCLELCCTPSLFSEERLSLFGETVALSEFRFSGAPSEALVDPSKAGSSLIMASFEGNVPVGSGIDI